MPPRTPLPEHRWSKVEALFSFALDLPPARWEPFLDAECGADRELRDEVLSLLTFSGGEPATLFSAIEAGAASLIHNNIHHNPAGRMLGTYRVEREIGRGGMSVVYLGSRADGHFQKHVAIKLIKRGMDTFAVIERLRRERRILASLDHPFIARLLDGGSTPEGSPYLVMEYVEGVPIDRFCDEQQLGIRERCELMVKVCEAVSYAHRKLVVHRDLKPANIFINAEGSPKLLDFGLAKILDAEADGTVTLNVAHARPLTPDYASPEQIRGLELTTATDVYSLGVILYQLLAGRRPFHLPAAPCDQWMKACETDPPRPSELASPWSRRLAGDLDNIVMKAMHKNAERRYASADDLAADLRRYLDLRPVLARHDSLWYRSAKFLRRRKYPVLAAAVALGGLITGLSVAVTQAHRAQAARRIAEAREQDAERDRRIAEAEHARAERERDLAVAAQKNSEERLKEIVNFSDRSLSGVYALMERLPGAVPARKELIESAFTALEQLARQAGADPRLRTALASAYSRLGDLQGGPDVISIGDVPAAMRSYRAGTALLESTPPPQMPREQQLLWVDMKRKLGRLLGQTDPKAGTAMLLDMLPQTAAFAPRGDVEFARDRAQILLALSRVNHVDLPFARKYAAEYLEACRRLFAQHPDRADLEYDVSVAQVEAGYLHLVVGDLEPVEVLYRQALEIREDLVRRFPDDSTYRRALMLIYRHTAAIEGGLVEPNLGHPELARAYLEKARPLAEEATHDPQDVSASASYATFLTEWAAVESAPERRAESIAALRRALSILEALPGVPLNGYGIRMATIHRILAQRDAEAGDFPAAFAEFRLGQPLVDAILARHADREALTEAFRSEAAITQLYAEAGDRANALAHGERLLARVAGGAPLGGDPVFLETWSAQAHLQLARVHRRFHEDEAAAAEARRDHQQTPPLAKNRAWDRNEKIAAEAQSLLESR